MPMPSGFSENGPTEYAIFPEENPDKKYTDFNIVKQKLQAQMNEVTKAEVSCGYYDH